MATQKEPTTRWTRRELLTRAGAGLAGASLLPGLAALADAPPVNPNPYGPFRMGIQSYSLRGSSFDEMLARTQSLGLRWLEAYPGHMPITDDPAAIAAYKAKLRAYNITLAAYGVVNFRNDEADARRTFAFAKALDIPTLSADPDPDAFGLLDKLCEEYKINIAIHNHGPGNRYAKWETILAAIEGHSPRIGACDDTGHYLRADEDPVTAAAKFGKRLYGVHLKDVGQDAQGKPAFTEIGKGRLDTVILLKTLNANGFPKRGIIALEYEEHEDNPMPYIEECLAATRRFVYTAVHPTLKG